MIQIQRDTNEYWLLRTNQVWKVLGFWLLLFLSIVNFLAMIMIINEAWTPKWIGELELGLGTIFFGFGALIWFSQTIKCPQCGYKPVWPILRSAPASEWLSRIVKLKECPACKDQEESMSSIMNRR